MNVKTEIVQKRPSMSVTTSNESPKGVKVIIPCRYIIAFLGFLSCAMEMCQRLNLSMALVAMVNQTAIHIEREINSTDCPDTSRVFINGSASYEDHYPTGSYLWGSEIQGNIMGVSFLGLMLSQTPGGRAAEIFGSKQILVISLICASICNILSPFSAEISPYVLLGVQFIKGVAHGFQQSTVGCLMAHWFPKPEKSFLSSIVLTGYPGGAVVGAVLIGILCDGKFLGGWPAAFYVFGVLGLILAVICYFFAQTSPEEDPRISDEELKYILSNLDKKDNTNSLSIPWKAILMSRKIWALLIALLGQFWLSFYFISAFPSYLGTVLHFTNTEIGYLNSFPYIGQMFIPYLTSYFADMMVKKGYATVDTVRKICNTACCVLCSLALIGASIVGCDRSLNKTFFVIAILAIGIGFPGSCIAALDMSINFAGTLFGLQATFGSISGIVLPIIVGLVTKQQTLAQWNIVIYITVGVVLASALIFHLFGSATLQSWDSIVEDKEKNGIANESFDANLPFESNITSKDIHKDYKKEMILDPKIMLVERL